MEVTCITTFFREKVEVMVLFQLVYFTFCPQDEYNIRSLQYFVDERIELIKEFGGDLEGCVGKMKSDVEKIILKKKEILLALSAK